MKQILNHLRTGQLELTELPAPVVEFGHLLIRTQVSLVSQGTEKMLVQFGKASLLQKARSQPEKVKQVLAKIRTEGLLPTLEAVFRKLDEPLPLGYCNAGVVIGVGRGPREARESSQSSESSGRVGAAAEPPGDQGSVIRDQESSRSPITDFDSLLTHHSSPITRHQFRIGDRVASNGPHAEIVSVPVNLCAKTPDNVSDDAAAFTVVGAIGLQGIRLAKPELGETFVVIGLGLIGQITAQLLKAHGCRVLGFDYDPSKVAIARTFGILAMPVGGEIDPVKSVSEQTGGHGADCVIITASTTSNDVISQSARMSRKRGRIILVGVVGLNINRADFYEKELTFQVSCSYGPGRYDDAYEEKGFDYPPAYVRWTENRNFQAVMEAMSSGALKVEPLITRRVALENYREIYDDMGGGGLASLLVYDGANAPSYRLPVNRDQGGVDAPGDQLPVNSDQGAPTSNQSLVEKQSAAGSAKPDTDNWPLITGNTPPTSHPSRATTIRVSNREVESPALAVIGAGNFTKMTAMPALAAVKAPVKFVVSSGGVTGTSLAKKYNVPFSSTDYRAVLEDPDVRGVIITTRHNLHAWQVIAGLNAGKHVLVEKPLCLTINELAEIEGVISSRLLGSKPGNWSPLTDSRTDGATDNQQPITDNRSTGSPYNQERLTNNQASLTVGYNRRFSPHIERMKSLLGSDSGPISFLATMNAGAIPLNHWVHDPEVGGGRILGEACHFIDLAIHLTSSLIVEVSATLLEGTTDSASILLRHGDGSTSVVNYFAQGHRELSKERVEVHCQGRSLLLDNFRELRGYGFKSFSKLKTRQDKGHAKQFALFAERVKTGGPALIPWEEVDNGMRSVFAVLRAITERRVVSISEMR